MRRPGRVLSRFELLEHAWDYEYENRSNVVDAYVRLLRKKIDKPFGTDVDRDRARRRLPAPRGERQVTSLPVRLRVTAGLHRSRMAALLAALGAFLYLQLRADLDETIDDNLRSRLSEVSGLVASSPARAGSTSPSADEDETFVQVLRANGDLAYSTLGGGRRRRW